MAKRIPIPDVTQDEWSDWLARLRDARALILKNAEAFHEAARVLEHIGQCRKGKPGNGLGAYESELLELAGLAQYDDGSDVKRLFSVVREARNNAIHEGAWARHLSSRLIDFFIVLEEGVMTRLDRIMDVMVRNPVTAELWWRVFQVRREFLSNSFSTLPIQLQSGEWQLITDGAVMRFLNQAEGRESRRTLLGKQMSELLLETPPAVDLASPLSCGPDELVRDVAGKMQDLPMLVVDDHQRLLGIVPPFDLL